MSTVGVNGLISKVNSEGQHNPGSHTRSSVFLRWRIKSSEGRSIVARYTRQHPVQVLLNKFVTYQPMTALRSDRHRGKSTAWRNKTNNAHQHNAVSVRSSAALQQLWHRSQKSGDTVFSVTSPVVRNSLPAAVREATACICLSASLKHICLLYALMTDYLFTNFGNGFQVRCRVGRHNNLHLLTYVHQTLSSSSSRLAPLRVPSATH